MYKYTNQTNDTKLQELLNKRKSPLLSQEGLQEVLQQLTLFLTTDVNFFACIFPKKDVEPLACSEIQKADFLLGSDNELYFPVFSTIEKLQAWKPNLQKGEQIYVFNKIELFTFLQINEKVAAVILNPKEDDVFLHRVLLQNMIQVQKDQALKK